MQGAVLVALIASIGNFLQGWDNATIAAAILYVKREFELEKEPDIEGLIVVISLVGAMVITLFSGAVSDCVGRRPLLVLSSVLYFIGSLLMLWSPNVYLLLVARLLDGFGIGLTVMCIPIYISETAPSEMRGWLNTLPQFFGCAGMFLSYCIVFVMSLMANPDWRLMLGVLSAPSILYFALTISCLPESPRWLVSKGRMMEAKVVLQRLCGKEDVSGEMALLVEGLCVGREPSIKEYMMGPVNDLTDEQGRANEKERIILFGFEEGICWVARPVTGQSMIRSSLVRLYDHESTEKMSPFVDHVVTLLGNIHKNVPDMGSMRSTLFPNFGSMFAASEQSLKSEQWDEEIAQREVEEYADDDAAAGDSDDDIHSPLLSRQATCMEEKEIVPVPVNHGTVMSMRRNSSLMQDGAAVDSTGIGGGWQLAWMWLETEGADGRKGVGLKRIYLRQAGFPGSRRSSLISLAGANIPDQGGYIQAAALVNTPALCPKELMDQHSFGPVMVHPSNTATKGPRWGDLFEAGVKRALFVGICIQILQQFAGINGILFYTPQILEQAGVEVLLSNFKISPDSASFFTSAITTLLMLPCIAIAMRLVDFVGRRFLLLATIPVLIFPLLVLTVVNLVKMGTAVQAVISIIGIIMYYCFFVMGFGPIPSILCSEIFPTSVRGVCISICSLAFWLGNIVVTYTFPLMLNSIDLAGVFGIYAVVCVISLVFVYLKVPETKAVPLEIISEFFAIGAKKAAGK